MGTDCANPVEERVKIDRNRPLPETASERMLARMLVWEPPALPGFDGDVVGRLRDAATWIPPGTSQLVRHRAPDGRRRVSARRTPPPGFEIEFDLGVVHAHGQPGTHRVLATPDGFVGTVVEGETADGYRDLGYVDTFMLPMFDALEIRRVPDTGELTLVCGEADPLFTVAEPVETIGFIDSFPIQPRFVHDLRDVCAEAAQLRQPLLAHWLRLPFKIARRLKAVLGRTPVGSVYRRARGR